MKKNVLIALYFILALITLVAISPFYFMLIMSTYRTQNLAEAVSLLPGNHFFINLGNVIASGFLRFYWNSLSVAVVFTVLSVFICAMAGYGFAKYGFKGNKILFAFVIGAMMIPAQLGLVGYVIQMRAMRLGGTLLPVILGDAASCFGVFWVCQYIRNSLPDAILESARIDGCSEMRTFFKIALPCIMPALAALAIIQFVFSWNYYLRPLVTISDPRLFTIPLGVATLSTRYQTDYAAQICALALATVPLIVVFIAGSKRFIAGLTSGAIKE
jgi:multiple sugar transport system permease protein/cellobiose transport system permease protein